MSVTFEIESVATGVYDVVRFNEATCDFDIVEATVEGDYVDAQAAFLCVMDRTGADRTDLSIEVRTDVTFDAANLSNANARLVLGYLGLALDEDDDLCGAEDGEAFLARCLVATVGTTPERATVVDGNWIDCGLSAEAVDVRVAALTLIAAEAARLGRQVVWA